MVWGCITSLGVGSLIMLEGSVNAEKYKNIILEGVLPTSENLTQKIDEPVFQDDSASCHRARSVSIGRFNTSYMTFPANSTSN